MATYVLVHGGYVGGWMWRKTAQIMRASGHDVYTPTLTGSGERIHLANREIGIETYLQDIINVLEYEDLQDVILVGHSLGGLTITGVAGRVPERLAQIVYLDAYLPESGQSGTDLFGPDITAFFTTIVEAFDGYRLPPSPDSPPMCNPQLSKPVADPVIIDNPDGYARLIHTFIFCTKDLEQADPGLLPVISAAARVRFDPAWNFIETNNNHTFMLDDPQLTANLLMGLAPAEK